MKSPLVISALPKMILVWFLWALPLSAQEPKASSGPDARTVADLLELVIDQDVATANKCLAILSGKAQSGELTIQSLQELRPRLAGPIGKILQAGRENPLYFQALWLAAAWKDPTALASTGDILTDLRQPPQRRLEALASLVAASPKEIPPLIEKMLAPDRGESESFTAGLLSGLGRLDEPGLAKVILARYATLAPQSKQAAAQLLTQRPVWSRALVAQVGAGQLKPDVLTLEQLRRLSVSPDPELARMVKELWGTVRAERDPQRDRVIAEVRTLLQNERGDPKAGEVYFHQVCAACHVIYGKGQPLGPDLTGNGRGSFEALLSNVLDPNLVIGEAYQVRLVTTRDGRALAGLLREDNPQRIVLAMPGGTSETLPRNDVLQVTVLPVSFMPEGLEAAMSRQQILDLFAFLLLDKPMAAPRP